MLIKSITVENFLPYQGSFKINFSSDPEQNVTLIRGNNGSGKTSLAQAFEWCLYGKTSYADQNVINAAVRDRTSPGSYAVVTVEIEIVHDNITNIVTRSQKYNRLSSGTVRADKAETSVRYIGPNGNMQYIPTEEQALRINELLSSELSHYFFFDGEHMKNMREEIVKGRSEEFAIAVRSILGLKPISNALAHLKGKGNANSVCRTFEKRYQKDDAKILVDGQEKIAELEKRIEVYNGRIKEQQEAAETADADRKRWEDLLDQFTEVEKAKDQLKKARLYRHSAHDSLAKAEGKLFETFRGGQYLYFGAPLFRRAIQTLDGQEIVDKGVPDVTSATIDFLIERGKCICGENLRPGSDARQHLEDLLKFIPPESVGTSISNFSENLGTRLEAPNTLYADFRDRYGQMRKAQRQVDNTEKLVQSAEIEYKSIKGGDVDNIKEKYELAKADYKKAMEAIGRYKSVISSANAEISEHRDKMASVKVSNENNEKVQRCLALTSAVYKVLDEEYSAKEKETKELFEKTVNEMYHIIYPGDITLSIDNSYGVEVRVNGVKSESKWKTNTAATLSIILAFILAMLNIARNHFENFSNNEGLLVGNTYPLVMDAPLSDFDPDHIHKICSLLPDAAEQVILMVNDKDAAFAEQEFGSRIGKRFEITKERDFKSVIEEK